MQVKAEIPIADINTYEDLLTLQGKVPDHAEFKVKVRMDYPDRMGPTTPVAEAIVFTWEV